MVKGEKMKFDRIHLGLFGGEGAAPAAGTDAGEVSADMAEKSETGSDAGSKTEKAPEETENRSAESSEKDRRTRFEELMRGEYRDLFAERTQKIIDRRFAETKAMEERLKGQDELVSRLAQKYGTDDIGRLIEALDGDDEMWQSAADAADMSVEQYRKYQKLERENAKLRAAATQNEAKKHAQLRLEAWKEEGEAVRKKYPAFSFETELKNENFAKMLRAGVSVSAAYQALHHDEIVAAESARAASDAERRITETIRARGERPGENGAQAEAGVTFKKDVSKLTRAERAEIAKRAMLGGKIEF